MKYLILCDSDNVEPFITPRQLSKINGEELVARTIRLLKENGIKDIIITSHDERFDKFGVERYEPKNNNYNAKSNEVKLKGFWLNAFPKELLKEPIVFLLGDVYYSDDAIKKIIESKTDKVLFFCSDLKNSKKSVYYIKNHDEPFGFKVVNYNIFKFHIDKLKKMWENNQTNRHPIAWELYRSINNLDVNTHILTDNYIGINDITCDIDNVQDIKLIEQMVILMESIEEGILLRVQVNETIKSLKDYEKCFDKNKIPLKSKFIQKDTILYIDLEMYNYLKGNNCYKKSFITLLDI